MNNQPAVAQAPGRGVKPTVYPRGAGKVAPVVSHGCHTKHPLKGSAASTCVFRYFLLLLIPVYLAGGCTTLPPLSESEQALLAEDARKASVVIYRSAAEGWLHRPIPVHLHVDGDPFIRLLGGEFVQIYLPGGRHEISVEYSRDCELATHRATQEMLLQAGQVLYLEVVPGFGEMSWIFCSPFQLVPFPMPGSRVELLMNDGEDARKDMGREINEDLLPARRIAR